jgi:hypothetical protein
MRIPEYLPKIKDQELIDFMTDVRNILNNGGYISQVGSAIPTATGDTGQTVLAQSGLQYSSFSYLNGGWREVPLDATRGWGYITIDAAGAAAGYQIASVTFPRTFTAPPLVLASYIGTKATNPATIEDITGANTLRGAVAYAVTVSGFSIAIFNTAGSTLTAGNRECFGYYAVAT